MLVVILGQQHGCPEVHRVAPPLREDVALELDVLHGLRVRLIGDRGDHLVAHQVDHRAGFRVDRHLLRRRKQIARGSPPVLAFPLIHVEPHRVAVGSLELRIHVHEGLHEILAARRNLRCADLVEARYRVPERLAVDLRDRTWLQVLHVHAEQGRAGGTGRLDRAAASPPAPLHAARLAGRRRRAGNTRDRHVHATGDGLGVHRRRKRDADAHTLEARGGGSAGRGRHQEQESEQSRNASCRMSNLEHSAYFPIASIVRVTG
jgi:hypothetical protein